MRLQKLTLFVHAKFQCLPSYNDNYEVILYALQNGSSQNLTAEPIQRLLPVLSQMFPIILVISCPITIFSVMAYDCCNRTQLHLYPRGHRVVLASLAAQLVMKAKVAIVVESVASAPPRGHNPDYFLCVQSLCFVPSSEIGVLCGRPR